MTIRELTYRQVTAVRIGLFGAHPTHSRHSSDVYTHTGGLPWYRETQTHPTQSAAYAAAVHWAREYEARDTMGNMARAHGVIADPKGGWRGVVNYFHSRT